MKKYILSTSLVAISLVCNPAAYAGKGAKDGVVEKDSQHKTIIRVANLPKEVKTSDDNNEPFMRFIFSLKGKPVSSMELGEWKGLSSDSALYGIAVIIADQKLEIGEIKLPWKHMEMNHPAFKKMSPEEIEKELFKISGERTKFFLSQD